MALATNNNSLERPQLLTMYHPKATLRRRLHVAPVTKATCFRPVPRSKQVIDCALLA